MAKHRRERNEEVWKSVSILERREADKGAETLPCRFYMLHSMKDNKQCMSFREMLHDRRQWDSGGFNFPAPPPLLFP